MSKKIKVENAAQQVALYVRGKEYVTAEAVAEALSLTKADIQRAFQYLGTQGWSFRPSNSLPYWRQNGPNVNRGRSKGEPYNHDEAEPDWRRTYYHVHEPKEK